MGGIEKSRFVAWTPDDVPAKIINIESDLDYEKLRKTYAPLGPVRSLDQVIDVIRRHRVKSIVVEERYIDQDYRSEHSHFYSTTFQRYPSIAHRLNFFTQRVHKELTDLDTLQEHYVGYCVMRPLETAPVGRTMIAPPPDVEARWCLAEDEVHLLGWTLTVKAVPFMSQDAQYLRCAHAAEWMILYHAHLFHGLPRRLPADIHNEALGGEVVDRQLPSMGLSVSQMLNSLHVFGLSPSRLDLPETRDESRARDPDLSLPGIVCRYVNSQMPPIVLSEEHAWVVSGYGIEGKGHAHDNAVFYVHDDAAGPYIRIADQWGAEANREKWLLVLPPLPRKSYLTAERAEAVALEILKTAERKVESSLVALREDWVRGEDEPVSDIVGLRTYGINSTLYKKTLRDRNLPKKVAQLYRNANLPRYIWVTEVQDRERRENDQPEVLGEIILDGTAHHLINPEDHQSLFAPLMAMHVGGSAFRFSPETKTPRVVTRDEWVPYDSGCPAPLLRKRERDGA